MSAPRTVSHPFHLSGPFAIFAQLENNNAPGSNYGLFHYESSISYSRAKDGISEEIGIKASTYGSVHQALLPGQSYFLMGRLLAINEPSTHNFTFTSTCIIPMGPTANIDHAHANSIMCYGLGIVKDIKDHNCKTSNGNSYKELFVVVTHSDWDCNAQNVVKFDIIYKVVGRGHLAKTHGLFQIGQEMLLSGIITSFDDDSLSWVVNVKTVSVTTGSLPRTFPTMSPNRPKGSSQQRISLESKRPKSNLIPSQSTASHAALNPSGSSLAPFATAQNIRDESVMQVDTVSLPNPILPPVVEEGEVFENTFPKKRTTKDILADAKKRLRQP